MFALERLGIKMNVSNSEASGFGNNDVVSEIMRMFDEPNGFSKLKPEQRKFLLGVILGSIVPVDGKIKAVEVQCLKTHLQKRYSLNAATIRDVVAFSNTGLIPEQLKKAAAQLQELLSIEDRTLLIGMLWDVAICDDELHSSEEEMIYKVADGSGVPRKRVAEQQARAQGKQIR